MFLGQLGFGVTLAPVGRFQFLKRVGFLQADTGKAFDFALKVQDFNLLQGILDAGLLFGVLLFCTPREVWHNKQQE
jgi:hypothetical protein